MTSKHYSWKYGPAEIEQHSIAKHRILEAYLSAYFQTLVGSGQRREEFKLTLVDGFAGGGLYYHSDTGEQVQGSPMILLNAEREAEFRANQNRTKPVRFDVTHFFIEKDKGTYNHLAKVLQEAGYASRFDKSIFLRRGDFESEAGDIIAFIKNKSRVNGRSIFILDQFGYTSVPQSLIKKILGSLPSAEIILTFAVDSLINFADEENFRNGLRQIEIPNCLGDRTLNEIKANEMHWRLFVQSALYHELVSGCGAAYYTPFFIRNRKGHGDYWLLHLSQHHKARDVMTEVHWQNHNHFIHYAGAGLDMFNMIGYDSSFDACYKSQGSLGFEFDDVARKASVAALMEQLPPIIDKCNEGLEFNDLFSSTCNTSPASATIYQDALCQLVAQRTLKIVSKDGVIRRGAGRIHASDRIMTPDQRAFFFI